MNDNHQSTARIEVTTRSLLSCLTDVLPFAGTDDTLPMLNAIGFEFAGTDLVLVATDRYVLGVSRLPIGETVVMPPRAIRLAAVQSLLKQFKPTVRGSDPMLVLDFGEEALAVETASTLDGQPTVRVAYPWTEANLPKWRALLVAGEVSTEPLTTHFNPVYLARFEKIQRGVEPVALWPTAPNKPWKVTVGDHFLGLIMPVRPADNTGAWEPGTVNVTPEPKRRSRKAAA